MNFREKLTAFRVPEGNVCIVWIEQAGFVLKTHGGMLIAIDPYLSDFVNRTLPDKGNQGFKRLTYPVFFADDIAFDYILATHEHGDHFDLDSIPRLLSHEKTVFYANQESIGMAEEKGALRNSFVCLKKGESYDLKECRLYAVDADHGDLSRDAYGFLLDFGFLSIYFSGDTCYNKQRLEKAIAFQPDIALLPINGAFGNLNEEEAAWLAADMNASFCVPCHFGTFAAHGGNPWRALEVFPRLAPACQFLLFSPGELYVACRSWINPASA
jgi:L-ascorbate 6-phosphate lactonase